MQTLKRHTTATLTINAPADTLFNIITAHENSHTWINEVKKVTVLKQGQPNNGRGTIRQVAFVPMSWSTITEEITECTPNSGFAYRITKGMPGLVNHQGVWLLKDLGNGQTQATWDVKFEFKKWHWFALFLSTFIKAFADVQQQALEGLAKKANETSEPS